MQSKHISHLITWLISSFVYLVLLFLAFWAFRQPNFYAATLGKISSTYARNPNDSTQIIKVKQPFRAITAQNMVQWDGEYYDYIHRYNYQYQEKAVFSRTNPQFHEAKFAFFPLFPWIWRLSHLAANQVIFLNFGLFILSLAVLIKEFVSHKNLQHYLFFFMLLMPSTIIFLIPYSEGVFFSMMTIALVGLKREKYLLVFLGLMGAAMTRPAVTLVGVAVIATEWVLFFKHKNFITLFKQLFLKLFPLLVGTFIVMWVQKEDGSGMWFKFMEVQKQWGTHLGLPKGISDWTWEGFGLDVSWLFLCFPLLCYALIRYLYQLFFIEKPSQNLYPDTAILLVSIGYLGLVSCFSLFLRAGGMNSLFRYAFCSPFFFIVILTIYQQIEKINRKEIHLPFLFFLTITLIFLGSNNYTQAWGFERIGFILMVLLLLALYFMPKLLLRYQIIIGSFLALISIIWNAYLLNMYICNGWIFT